MAERTPATARYDAIVDFEKTTETAPSSAYGLVKFTYDLGPQRLVPAAAEPLFHDLREPDIEPRLCPGSDFWPHKLATDVVVMGSAWHGDGRAHTHRTIALKAGAVSKSIAVFGRRRVEAMRGNVPVFGPPEPFTEMPVVNANAYGGWDARVPMPRSAELKDVLARQFDHPGIYPRNPFGKGYVVVPELPENDLELPNLEDPRDRLTPERFFVRDARRWYAQPLPWCFDWSSPTMFHRYVWLGEDAWFPAPPDAALPEVQRGMLPAAYRTLAREFKASMGPPPLPFLQEASLGMVLRDLTEGATISVTGMHPEFETLSFLLPSPPALSFSLGEAWTPAQPRLHSIAIMPGRRKVQLLYGATFTPPTQRYVPGVHARIPLAMRVDRDPPILYAVPTTIGEMHRAHRNER